MGWGLGLAGLMSADSSTITNEGKCAAAAHSGGKILQSEEGVAKEMVLTLHFM